MISIVLSDFIEFHNRKYGSPKFTKVRQIFQRGPYHPAFDFYKPIRQAIVENVKDCDDLKQLSKVLQKFEETTKERRYSRLIPGWIKFFKKNNLEWFTPPSKTWVYKDLHVKVNPELGLVINDEPYIIKLHFKETPLKNSDVQTLVRMMQKTVATGIFNGYKCAILDVERSKLHEIGSPSDPLLDVYLEAEADSFIRLWEQLKKSA